MKKIQILGPGCSRCEVLAKHARQAADELDMPYELTKVTDIKEIMSFGVMSTPGLVIDGKVISAGRVVPVEEIKRMLA
jgi:small redox-active disulfide protein 2